MKYCKHCGKEIDENSRFCNYCGKEQAPSICKLFVIKMINNERFERLFLAIILGLVCGSSVFFYLIIFLDSKLVLFGVGLLFFIVAFISTIRYKRREIEICNKYHRF